MSAQPAYSLYPERAVERAPRTRISVVPGQRTRSAAPASTVTPGLVLKAAIIVMAVLALVGIASLTLSAATVTTSMQSQALSSQIDDARAQGSSLEVTQSLLSNSTRVRHAGREARHGGACGSGYHQHARRRGFHQRRWVAFPVPQRGDRHQRRGVARYAESKPPASQRRRRPRCPASREQWQITAVRQANTQAAPTPAAHIAPGVTALRGRAVPDARSERDARASRSRSGASAAVSPPSLKAAPRASSRCLNAERALAPLFLFGLVVALFFGKLVWLQVIKAPEFTDQAQAQRTSKIVLEPRRGTIYDRNGVVLATSVDATTIYVNPAEVSDPNLTAGILAQVLGGEAEGLSGKGHRQRHVLCPSSSCKADTSVGDEVRQLASERVEEAQNKETADAKAAGRKAETIASGIHYVSRRAVREYPNAQVGGQVVGACSIGVDSDTNREYYYGICGLEAAVQRRALGHARATWSRSAARPASPYPGRRARGGGRGGRAGHRRYRSTSSCSDQVEESPRRQGCEGPQRRRAAPAVRHGRRHRRDLRRRDRCRCLNPADHERRWRRAPTQLKAVTQACSSPARCSSRSRPWRFLETGSHDARFRALFCPAVDRRRTATRCRTPHERGDATFTLRQILDQSSNVGISLATEKMGFEELYDHIKSATTCTRAHGGGLPGEGEDGTDALGMLAPYDQWAGGYQAYNVRVRPGRRRSRRCR